MKKRIYYKITSLLLAAVMLAAMLSGAPAAVFAADEGIAYGDVAGRVLKPFTLVGFIDDGGRVNNRAVADECDAFLWDGGDGLFYPVEFSEDAIIGNFVELRYIAPAGGQPATGPVNRMLIVSWEDSRDYWDADMFWDDDIFDDDGAFSDGQEWRIPYGERLIAEYGIGGAAEDYSNIVGYGALEDSTYWPLHDYYNATSGDTLTMLTGFRTTQQSTGWACGVTSALMAMDWFGLMGDLNEQDLASLRRKPTDGGATNLQQLINVFENLNDLHDLGIGEWGEWEIYSSYDVVEEYGITRPAGAKYHLMAADDLMDGTTIREFLENGIPIIIGWNSFGGHWQVIVGYDDMGSEHTKDHVLILADPYDTTDHLNDGYNIQSLERFVYDWSAGFDPDFRHGVFVAAVPVGWEYEPDYGDGITEYRDGYDGDGGDGMKLNYGRSAADLEKYYPTTPWRGDNGLAGAATGGYERVPNNLVNISPYYAHFDFYGWESGYNPVSGGELIILENFRTQQQITEWTCGLTSVLMAMEWFDANPGQPYLINGYSDGELAAVAGMFDIDAYDLIDDRLTEVNLAMMRGAGRTRAGATYLDDMKNIFDSLNDDLDYLNAMAEANGWEYLKKWEYLSTDDLVSGYIRGEGGARHYLDEGAEDDGVIPYFLDQGYPILIGWDEWGGHWQVIIGYDDMGTEDTQDDVLILADPYDTTDHNQDGYYLEPFERLVFGWGAAFDRRGRNIFFIPYLVDTDIPAEAPDQAPDEILDAILGAIGEGVILEDVGGITGADAFIEVFTGIIGDLGYAPGIDYAIADASALGGKASDFYVSAQGVATLTLRVRCGVEVGVIKAEISGLKLVGATANAKSFISIKETAKNSRVWELRFFVAETWSDGNVKINFHCVNISANNANIEGQYNLGAYTLIYDIKGNGSNIKEFRVVMN